MEALVLAGRHDPIPLDAPEEIAARLGGDLRILEESGHCPHVEEPDRFADVLDRWLPAA